MRFPDLDSWLRWQETLHPKSVELGLERVARVWSRLGPLPDATRVITVAGTNGKGSCVAVMAAVLAAAGRRIVAYTSPHLRRYNERVRVDGAAVEDATLIEAFAAVDGAREGEALTYFEFGTLAALKIVTDVTPDVALLEVGLGGRLDAVNVVDPDAAVITPIGLDHSDWLGSDRESIGAEKAGILRPGLPLVLGDPSPPASVLRRAAELNCTTTCLARDFRAVSGVEDWRFEGSHRVAAGLPYGPLRGPLLDNAASAIEALDRLPGLPEPSARDLRAGCGRVALPGRLQHLPGSVDWLVDLAHNAPAAQALASYVRRLPAAAETHAVIGLYADKDAAAILAELDGVVGRWWCVGTPGSRARPAAALARLVEAAGGDVAGICESVPEALERVEMSAPAGSRVLVLGSFSVVGPALERLGPAPPSGAS